MEDKIGERERERRQCGATSMQGRRRKRRKEGRKERINNGRKGIMEETGREEKKE